VVLYQLIALLYEKSPQKEEDAKEARSLAFIMKKLFIYNK